MPRPTLDRELQALHEQLLTVGSHITIALQQLLLVLDTGDQEIAYALITLESTIDHLSQQAEERTLRLLILQQPLGGQDLRFLMAALHIEIDLKRAGTLVAEMARILLSLLLSPESTLFHIRTHRLSLYTEQISALDHDGYVTEIFVLRGIFNLGQAVQHLLEGTMEALAQKSVARAEAVRQEYVFLEQRHHQLSQELMMMLWKTPALSALQRNTSILQRIAQLFWMTHEMKQLAQYAASICTHILFIVKGKR